MAGQGNSTAKGGVDGGVAVLLNASAGRPAGGPGPAGVIRAFEATGVRAEVRPTPAAVLGHAAREANLAGAAIVVAAGGDGTVSAVAGALAGTQTALGVLPLGTLNHFAKDLHLPLDLDSAVRVVAAGNTRRVDLGEVNGRFFINNASIGLYPRIVFRRDREFQRLGRGKWIATLLALLRVFRRYPLVKVVLHAPHASIPRTTPFVFVGNNRYDMRLLSLGGRPALDRGELSVYFANRTGRLGLLRLMFRALIGRLDQARDFDSLLLPALRIETGKGSLRVALDGEVMRVRPPLEFRVRPGALKVLVP